MAGSDHFPTISFYLPKPFWQEVWPQSGYENWKGFGLGVYAWTLQTYLQLRADLQQKGLDCQLVDQVPCHGIVLAHSNSLQIEKLRPQPQLPWLLICLKAESLVYPYAQVHVVQNRAESNRSQHFHFIPHWTQPGLIPRDVERGDKFENLVFFGHQDNLASELQQVDWHQFLVQQNLRWSPVVNANHWSDYKAVDNRWNDYRQVDAVVAVRSFDSRVLKREQYFRKKPATKLYNAWLAGVPAILGAESAYRAERQSELDYLEVTSMAELRDAIRRLQFDGVLRRAMIENGQHRARAIRPDQIRQAWLEFLLNVAVPAYQAWGRSPVWQRRLTLQQCHMRSWVARANRKWLSWRY